MFEEYAAHGTGKTRHYVHDAIEAEKLGTPPGTFTEWGPIAEGTDLLFYEGLHGAMVHGDIDLTRHADIRIGVVPVINLEWIQKIHRDRSTRNYSTEAVMDTILRRMPDYVNYICPQFTRTDINFQRVPTVDTSNPFIARWIPTPDESIVVIRFRNPRGVDFPYLLSMIGGSFASRANCICYSRQQAGSGDAADPDTDHRADDRPQAQSQQIGGDFSMARITLRQLLDHAAERGYGVPAFNINNMEQVLAIMVRRRPPMRR